MQYPNFTIVSDETTAAGSGGEKPTSPKSKPQRVLPSARVKVSNQLDLLRAYAISSNFGGAPTTYVKAAELAKLGTNSASLCNAFFYELGLITRVEGGAMPSQAVIEYARAHEWGREDSATRLAPAVRSSWFARTLVMHLKMRPISVGDAIQRLAEEAGVGRETQSALRMCIDYLVLAGLVSRNGDMLQLCDVGEAAPVVPPAPATEEETEMPAESIAKERALRPPAASNFQQPSGGSIRLAFDVTVTMAEMATWDPHRITAFFAGVAQVLSAKNGTEND